MSRLTHLLLVASIIVATLLEEVASIAVEQANLGDDHDYIHHDSAETLAVYGDRAVDDLDYKYSLEVEDAKVNEQVHDTSKEYRLVKRNSIHASGQRAILFSHAQHRFESMEDDDEMLFQQHRGPTANRPGNHQLWDMSDEQQSWEVTDGSLKKLFGIRWDSAKNPKFTRLSSVDDSVEDLLRGQHKAQWGQIRSKRPSGTAF